MTGQASTETSSCKGQANGPARGARGEPLGKIGAGASSLVTSDEKAGQGGGPAQREALFSAMPAPGKPSISITDPLELIIGYLDFSEEVTLRKIGGLSDEQLRASTVPTGWSLLGMVKHLACTERFWVRHIFLGEYVDFSWPGNPIAEWQVDESDSAESICHFYREERAHTRHALSGMSLSTRAKRPFRTEGGDAPTLGWVLCHLMQEAARHAGHIARELTDGTVGSD